MDQFAGEPAIEERVGDALAERNETVAVAESATGGLVGALLSAVPGSSAYFDRAHVTYSYDAKRDVLAIPRETLDEHGAVSDPIAQSMARAARDLSDTEWAVSTTGVGGPSGGSAETPVGTVFVGVAWAAPWGSEASGAAVERYQFDGDRAATRERMARQALSDLLESIDENRTGQ